MIMLKRKGSQHSIPQQDGTQGPTGGPAALGLCGAGLLVALVLGVFCIVVLLSARYNDYPVYFHPNSPGQTREVLRGSHNYRQPLLLVTATRAARLVTGMPSTSQAVGELGNWVAAVVGGLAAVCMTLLAFVQRGWLAAVCAGVMLSLCSPLIYYGHFFKEDTALAFGCALVFLMLALFLRKPDVNRIAMVGAACGLAIAGKYLGVLVALVALPIVVFTPLQSTAVQRSRLARFAWFFIPCLICFLAASYPVLMDPKEFVRGVAYEIVHVVVGTSAHGYVEAERLRTMSEYRNWAAMEMPLVVFILAGVGLMMCLLRWRRWPAMDKIVLGFAMAFIVLVAQSKLQTSRHFLPALFLLHYIAAMGIVSLVSWERLGRVLPWALALAILAPTTVLQWQHVRARLGEFPLDSRFQLADWIDRNLPAEARIASCSTCALPEPGQKFHDGETRRLRQHVDSATHPPDLGTLDELVAQGFTHVAVSGKRIRQVMNKNRLPRPEELDRHLRRSSFYSELQQRGRLAWQSHQGVPTAPRGTFSGELLMLYDITALRGPERHDAVP